MNLATQEKKGEVACFGTRGDGKTWAALGAMIVHAQRHHEASFPLPAKWIGAADTYTSHKAKTLDSLTAPGWQGRWQLRDDAHVAVFRDQGAELVHLRLLGVEDQGGQDRLRAECHGIWFEEPAPSSVLVQSSGLSETAWGLALTSRRLPSHHRPAIMTGNYPDEDHWTWQRFVVRRHPGTAYVRIPPGERASAEDRAEWMRALEGRPDMQRRLLEGQPGTLMLGAQVAAGFNMDEHVSQGRLAPDRQQPLWLGQDGGHTPTTVIGQRVGQEVRILGALSSEHDGMRGHLRSLVLPWLGEHAPWVLEGRDLEALRVRYDPAIDTDEQADIESNPLRVMRRMLPGVYRAGPVSWDGRKDPLLALLGSRRPRLLIDPECRGLIKALNGAWYYPTGMSGAVSRDLPKKPNHPHEDYGDAFCYLVAGMAPMREQARPIPQTAKTAFDVWDYSRQPRQPRVAVTSLWRD